MIAFCNGLPGRVRLRGKRTAIALLAIALLTGCGRFEFEERDATRAEIVGTWKGADGATLDLGEQGTFTAHELSVEAQEGAGTEISDRSLVSGRGEWSFGDYSTGPELDLHFTDGGGVTLWPADKDGELVLWGLRPDGDGAASILTR